MISKTDTDTSETVMYGVRIFDDKFPQPAAVNPVSTANAPNVQSQSVADFEDDEMGTDDTFSWTVSAYVEEQGHNDVRTTMLAELLRNITSLEYWMRFLDFEEANFKHPTFSARSNHGEGSVRLPDLYMWAILCCEKQLAADPDLRARWKIRRALLHWHHSGMADDKGYDKEDWLKDLLADKDTDCYAHSYVEYAKVLHEDGQVDEAREMLMYGDAKQAEPRSVLEASSMELFKCPLQQLQEQKWEAIEASSSDYTIMPTPSCQPVGSDLSFLPQNSGVKATPVRASEQEQHGMHTPAVSLGGAMDVTADEAGMLPSRLQLASDTYPFTSAQASTSSQSKRQRLSPCQDRDPQKEHRCTEQPQLSAAPRPVWDCTEAEACTSVRTGLRSVVGASDAHVLSSRTRISSSSASSSGQRTTPMHDTCMTAASAHGALGAPSKTAYTVSSSSSSAYSQDAGRLGMGSTAPKPEAHSQPISATARPATLASRSSHSSHGETPGGNGYKTTCTSKTPHSMEMTRGSRLEGFTAMAGTESLNCSMHETPGTAVRMTPSAPKQQQQQQGGEGQQGSLMRHTPTPSSVSGQKPKRVSTPFKARVTFNTPSAFQCDRDSPAPLHSLPAVQRPAEGTLPTPSQQRPPLPLPHQPTSMARTPPTAADPPRLKTPQQHPPPKQPALPPTHRIRPSPAPEQQRRVQYQGVPDDMSQGSMRSMETENDMESVVVAGEKYLVMKLIGKGGTAKVMKVWSPSEQRDYALKKVDLRGHAPTVVDAFMQEESLLKELKGKPSVVQMKASEVRRGKLFMVLELGQHDMATVLQPLLKLRSKLPMDSVFKIDAKLRFYWLSMLEGLHVVHEARVVHADLKPHNYLMVNEEVKLIDFGIAKKLPDDHTCLENPNSFGTPSYMSPEAITNHFFHRERGMQDVTRKADVWSLGIIMYTMITGRMPFRDATSNQEKAHAIMNREIQMPRVDDPAALDVLRRCLQKDVRDRICTKELMSHPFVTGTPPISQPVPAADGTYGKRVQLAMHLARQRGVDVFEVVGFVTQRLDVGMAVSEHDVEQLVMKLAATSITAAEVTPCTSSQAAALSQRPPMQPPTTAPAPPPPPPPPPPPFGLSVGTASSRGRAPQHIPQSAPRGPSPGDIAAAAAAAAASRQQRMISAPVAPVPGMVTSVPNGPMRVPMRVPIQATAAAAAAGGVQGTLAEEAARKAAERRDGTANAVQALEQRPRQPLRDMFAQELQQQRQMLRPGSGHSSSKAEEAAAGCGPGLPVKKVACQENDVPGCHGAPASLASHLQQSLQMFDFGETDTMFEREDTSFD